MGGSGSGRWGGCPVIDDGLTLDINHLRRAGYLARSGGRLTWFSRGEPVASLTYASHLQDDRGTLRLSFDVKVRDVVERVDQVVRLEATPQPFGGRRWWFVCPRTGRHVSKLYLPPGDATRFASRAAHGRTAYRSQRMAPLDRAVAQAFVLRRRLGVEGPLGAPVPRPPGMRQTTYRGLLARLEAAEARAHAGLLVATQRLM